MGKINRINEDQTCDQCGNVYRRWNKTKYCGEECNKAAGRENGRKLKTSQCRTCGSDFEKTRNSRRVYCSDKCNSRRVKQTDCAFCGVTFQPKVSAYSTCCSRQCGWYYNQMRFEAGELDKWGAAPVPLTPQEVSIRGCVRAIKKVQRRLKKRLNRCILCGEPHLKTSESISGSCCRGCKSQSKQFTWSNIRSPICMVCQEPRQYGEIYRSGKRCAVCELRHKRAKNRDEKRKRRAKKKGAKRIESDITLGRIARRDGDSCHICGDEVDWSASPQSNWYPSVDHVIPLSKGGNHTMDNVKLAHRWCNSVKCDNTECDLSIPDTATL